MKTMYERFLKHVGDEQSKKAFIDGFKVAMDTYEHRYPLEYSKG